MATSVVIAAPDQTTANELHALVDELDDFTVIDVADSTSRLGLIVTARDPEIALVHERLGPEPALQTLRDLNARRPGTALVLVVDQLIPERLTDAMDAGARSVIAFPPSIEELGNRLTNCAEWIAQMRRHLTTETPDGDSSISRGTVIAVAGAKGGVGTTTIATHLAHHAVRQVAGRSVCLVDLDVEKGDVGTVLGIAHRLDVSDLAKVAEDLTNSALGSSIHRSESGLATILSPARLEDVGAVGDREVLLILAALRRQFDLVIVDVGCHVTPASSAAVETADDVVLVTTADVLSLRSVHRTTESWRRFGSRENNDVKILLNRTSRSSAIQVDTAARLLPTQPLGIHLPDAAKLLEPGVNRQSPEHVVSKTWWGLIGELCSALKITSKAPEARPRRRLRATAESGQATIEFASLIWLILLLVVAIWQLGLWATAVAMSGHAADEAARSASINQTPQQIRSAGLAAVPDWMQVDVSSTYDEVKVKTELPLIIPSFTLDGLAMTSNVRVVHQ